MESKFQTSFIPKKSLDERSGVRVKTPISILYIIAIFLTVVTISLGVVMYGYKYITSKSIESKKEALAEKQKNFDYDAVEDVVKIDTKLKSADGLLKNHVAVSNLLYSLQENTIRNLRFSAFKFEYLTKDKITVTMNGEANSFGAVARQAEVFASLSKDFKDSIFSDLNAGEDGGVTFSFLTSVNPSFVTYKPNSQSQ